MKAGSEHVRLSDLIAITHGFAFKGVDFACSNDTTLPIVLTPGNFSEDACHIFSSKNTKRFTGDIPEKFLFSKGELTVVMTDLSSKMKILGKPAFVEKENILHNQRIGRVIFNSDKLLDRYLYYFLQSEKVGTNIRQSATGTMVRHTAPNRILSLDIHLPPLDEQKRIVAVLDAAFDGLTRARANVEANLKNARELFEATLDKCLVQDALDWPEHELKTLGKLTTGGTPKSADKDQYGDAIPFIKPGHFQIDGSLNYDDIGLSKAGKDGARVIPKNSALMVCIGATIGKSGHSVCEITTNQQINALTPDEGLHYYFAYLHFITPTFQRQVLANSGQATLPIINKTKWGKLKMKVPPTLSQQQTIVDSMRKIRVHVDLASQDYKSKLADLDELRQSLLQKAFAGELT